jgi:hypothetical protein
MLRILRIAKIAVGLAVITCFMVLAGHAQTALPQPSAQVPPGTQSMTGESTIVLPAGTNITLALTSPIMARTAKAGDSVYAETAFPVAANNQMAIPIGTYVLGQIDHLTLPGWFSPHAEFQMHFTKIIFANGYTVEIPQPAEVANGHASSAAVPGDDVIPAVATPYVQVSTSNDVLLDNGSQINMVLQNPLQLNSVNVAAAVARSDSGPLPLFKSATRCWPSPGTPDTVIPGTPGTPGTPPTVIPGGPGEPPTVIPGMPGTPGTPPTVISGIAPVYCPGPPVVTADPKAMDYKEPLQIASPTRVDGRQLPAGKYEAAWTGSGPTVVVNIVQAGNAVAAVPARFVLLSAKSPADTPDASTDSTGAVYLRSLRFAGQSFALYFDQGRLSSADK